MKNHRIPHWLAVPGTWRAQSVQIALALGLGAGGGFLLALTGMPLAWFLGAMLTTIAASLAGMHIAIPDGLRALMIAVLGVMIGSAFTAEVFGAMIHWWPSLIVLLGFVSFLSMVTYFVLRRVCGFDAVTAFFSCMPGGMAQMAVMGEEAGADLRRITLIHITRVMTVVTLIPLYFRFVEHAAIGSTPAGAERLAALDPTDGALLAVSGVLGWGLGRGLRLPAPALVGPLIASVFVHAVGLVDISPPTEIVAAAQVVIGASIGSRFSGFSLRRARHTLFIGVAAGTAMTGAALLAAAAVSGLVAIDRSALILALAPGGVAEMGLMALSMDISTAYVSTAHILRIALIVLLAPLAFRAFSPGTGPGTSPGAGPPGGGSGTQP